MTVEFTLDRVEFVALNGGPQFKFTEAISFSVNCETQDEIDYFWEKLSADGGSTGRCGWVKDRFGLSWQVNPVFLGDMLVDPDKAKAARVINALMDMDKIEIAALEKAAVDGVSSATLLDLVVSQEFPHLHADQSLAVALERMGTAGLDALPVVSRANVHKLEGIVALQDVLKFYGFASQIEPPGHAGS